MIVKSQQIIIKLVIKPDIPQGSEDPVLALGVWSSFACRGQVKPLRPWASLFQQIQQGPGGVHEVCGTQWSGRGRPYDRPPSAQRPLCGGQVPPGLWRAGNGRWDDCDAQQKHTAFPTQGTVWTTYQARHSWTCRVNTSLLSKSTGDLNKMFPWSTNNKYTVIIQFFWMYLTSTICAKIESNLYSW